MKKHHTDVTVDKAPVFRARILAIERNVSNRKAPEAIEIRDRRPAINRNRGWRLDWFDFIARAHTFLASHVSALDAFTPRITCT